MDGKFKMIFGAFLVNINNGFTRVVEYNVVSFPVCMWLAGLSIHGDPSEV